ncbi:hypothetical protein GCM10027589_15190 [Actinocorallia lasiicapitis]
MVGVGGGSGVGVEGGVEFEFLFDAVEEEVLEGPFDGGEQEAGPGAGGSGAQ